MKNIKNAPFIKEMCEATANMYRLGWDERNGGNISYMLDEKEVGKYLNLNKVIRIVFEKIAQKLLRGVVPFQFLGSLIHRR